MKQKTTLTELLTGALVLGALTSPAFAETESGDVPNDIARLNRLKIVQVKALPEVTFGSNCYGLPCNDQDRAIDAQQKKRAEKIKRLANFAETL